MSSLMTVLRISVPASRVLAVLRLGTQGCFNQELFAGFFLAAKAIDVGTGGHWGHVPPKILQYTKKYPFLF